MSRFLYIFIFISGLSHLNAQKKVNLEEKLQGYHIAMEDEMSGQPVDVSRRVKLYLNDGTVIKHRNSDMYFNPDQYDKLIYLDQDGKIRAFVFTKIDDDILAETTDKIDLSEKQKAVYFNLTDLNGKKYTLDDLKGKIIVMNYWFSACRPCVMEMPELNKLVTKYRDKNVVFLGLTYNVKPNIERFLQRFEFDYNLIPEAQIEIHNYQVKTYPTHIVIDQKGYIVLREEGLNYDTVDILDQTIQHLLDQ